MIQGDRYSSCVLVSIPTYRTPQGMLFRAVKSVLNQTHRNLQVVVVADGERITEQLPRDDRLTVFRLQENHGAYFAQSVSLTANPHPWYAPHGSDDWTDPEHLERLLAIGTNAVATGAVWWHKNDVDPPTVHRANYEVGVFKTDRLRALGGYNPNERMGQDSLMLKLLGLTGGFMTTQEPTYHRVRRPGSLTTHPDTKIGSRARNEMRARNRAIFAKAAQSNDPETIRKVRESFVPSRVRQQVETYALELRSRL